MPDPMPVTRTVSIPLSEVELRVSRSSGPGGQHANVTASRVEAIFDVAGSAALKVGTAATVTLTGDTSASVVDSAALGLVVRSNTTPTGSASFDNFSSTRFTAP